MLFITSVGLFLALLFFWSNYDYKPLTVERPIIVTPSKVESGGVVTMVVKYCKSSNQEEVVSRDLVGDTIIINIPPKRISVRAPKGCDVSESIIRIPRTINPGMYKIQYHIEYRVNPIRTVEVHFESEPFEIILLPKDN